MLDRHVSDHLAAYLDGEISASQRERVETHVARCVRCREDLEQVRAGVAAMRMLPVVSAPAGLWDAIEAAAEAPAKTVWSPWWTWRWAAAVALLVVVAGGGLWTWLRPEGGPWEVAAVEGAPTAGSRRVSGSKAVATGAWVETDARSRARIRIGTIGTVQVEPNTAVRLLLTDATAHRLALQSGEIMANISAPPRLFFVETPAGTAVDLGCEYRLHCDRGGTGMLSVTRGWVALEWKERESLVPGGASCRLYAGRGPGVPWFEDATQTFVRAVEGFDSGEAGSVSLMLGEARVRDTLTLWHLLARVDAGERGRVYERMVQLAPEASNVSRERVLRLDAEALKQWRDELAWIW